MSDASAGRLLVATPLLAEPPFLRTVILLLQAGADDGALGVVLNRPSGTALGEVLPGWGALAAEPDVVFEGGPVQTSAALCLGRPRPGGSDLPWLAPLDVGPGPRLGTVDLEAAPDVVGPSVEALRVFAGYAGWSPDQLEGEVAEGAWWVVDALPGDAFSSRPELLWPAVLRRHGPPLAFAATWPDDPTQN